MRLVYNKVSNKFIELRMQDRQNPGMGAMYAARTNVCGANPGFVDGRMVVSSFVVVVVAG